MRRVDPKVYTKEYYLKDCSGYELFNRTKGKRLEPRLKALVKKIPMKPAMRVLDIGCGRGEMVFWAAAKGAEATGIDYSKSAIDLAKKAQKKQKPVIKNNVKFGLGDAKKLEFPKNSFDMVFMIEVLEHLYPEEQEKIMKEIRRVLTKNGKLFIHTAPSKTFNDVAYPFWCYPMSTTLVGLSNLLFGSKYPNIASHREIRTKSHKAMHVNEPTYFSLKALFEKHGFSGSIRSTNITVKKPEISWKDKLFNSLVYFHPISNFPPFNIVWGNDFWALLKKI